MRWAKATAVSDYPHRASTRRISSTPAGPRLSPDARWMPTPARLPPAPHHRHGVRGCVDGLKPSRSQAQKPSTGPERIDAAQGVLTRSCNSARWTERSLVVEAMWRSSISSFVTSRWEGLECRCMLRFDRTADSCVDQPHQSQIDQSEHGDCKTRIVRRRLHGTESPHRRAASKQDESASVTTGMRSWIVVRVRDGRPGSPLDAAWSPRTDGGPRRDEDDSKVQRVDGIAGCVAVVEGKLVVGESPPRPW